MAIVFLPILCEVLFGKDDYMVPMWWPSKWGHILHGPPKKRYLTRFSLSKSLNLGVGSSVPASELRCRFRRGFWKGHEATEHLSNLLPSQLNLRHWFGGLNDLGDRVSWLSLFLSLRYPLNLRAVYPLEKTLDIQKSSWQLRLLGIRAW